MKTSIVFFIYGFIINDTDDYSNNEMRITFEISVMIMMGFGDLNSNN